MPQLFLSQRRSAPTRNEHFARAEHVGVGLEAGGSLKGGVNIDMSFDVLTFTLGIELIKKFTADNIETLEFFHSDQKYLWHVSMKLLMNQADLSMTSIVYVSPFSGKEE